jgi:medium-chain acyl-[acyl-carrier-protein] hydrolase
MKPELCSTPWIKTTKLKSKIKLRLFCLPYAGGGTSIFRTWSEHLPPEIEVFPIQLPGRESRWKEPLLNHISPLVETLVTDIYPYLQETTFAFFGHSMGALIAFELTRTLYENYNFHPIQLFVSGRAAPQITTSDLAIHQLPESEFIEELRRLDGTPEAILQNAELMKLLMPILRADFAICETYIYSIKKQLQCPISIFGGLEDKKSSYENLIAWRELTNNEHRLRLFPGNHFFIQSVQPLVLSAILQDIEQTYSLVS